MLKQTNLIERVKSKKIEKKNKKKANKKRNRKGLKATFPGEVVQIDVKHLPQKRKTYYQFTAIDKYTRLSYQRCIPPKAPGKQKSFS